MGLSSVMRTTAVWRTRRDQGSDIYYERVERNYAGKTYDMWGFADYVYIENGEMVWVQICTNSRAEHRRKILSCPLARRLLAMGQKVLLVTWRKIRVRKNRPKQWEPRWEWITLEDFNEKANETELQEVRGKGEKAGSRKPKALAGSNAARHSSGRTQQDRKRRPRSRT